MRKNKNKLYRCYDKNENLIYVGISLSVLNRLANHNNTSKWFKHVATIKIQNHLTREAAIRAEARIIKYELPVFNIVGHPKKKRKHKKHGKGCPQSGYYR